MHGQRECQRQPLQAVRLCGLALLPGFAVFSSLCGCNPISIEPRCPSTLRVGESGPIQSGVKNPGGIATYQWEALDPGAGTFDNPSAPDTRFTPLVEGIVALRLTASDGLFQVISQCETTVAGLLGVAVAFSAEPNTAQVGETVTLTCDGNGSIGIMGVTISQTNGAMVELIGIAPFAATFVPSQIGDHSFRCVGESAAGAQTAPAFLTVTVRQAMLEPDPGEPGGTGNGGLPPRGGGRG